MAKAGQVSKGNGSLKRHRKAYIKKRRDVLFAESACCHWCNCATINEGESLYDPNRATLDHIKSWEECGSMDEYRKMDNMVLACLECNQRRDHERQLKQVNARG